MKRTTLWKNVLAALGMTALLAACGGVTEGSSVGDQQPAQGVPQPGLVTAQDYPPYDPEYHCLLSSHYVACSSGIYMNTYWSSEWGHYIERNVCSNHGGPIVCPY
jgi:hypothetical protein